MTPERIAELRAFVEKAAPGPWTYKRYGVPGTFAKTSLDSGKIFVAGIDHIREEDVAFIAAARIALPEALDAIEQLRRDLNHEAVVSDMRARERNAALHAIERVRAVIARHKDKAQTKCWHECSILSDVLTALRGTLVA